MNIEQIVVLVTAPSTDVAEKISNALLENELAACMNIIPSIDSLYKWKGKINNDKEVLLIIKTRFELFDDTFINVSSNSSNLVLMINRTSLSLRQDLNYLTIPL